MAEDKAVSRQQVRRIAQRALDIERYLLRRAWGLGYAVAAVEILLIASLPAIFGAAGLPYGLVTRIIVNTAISLTGLVVISSIFKRAYFAMQVRREIVDSVWAKMLRPLRAAIVWLVYYLPIIVALLFLRPYAAEILYGVLVASAFPFFFALKISFPEKLPRESIAALAAYTACTLSNFTLILLRTPLISYLVVWIVLSAVFLSAALYAYRQQPPNPLEDKPS